MGSPTKNNRKDVLKKGTNYLQNEFSSEDQSELLNDISANPNQLINEERQFKDFVKAKIHRQKPSDKFLEDLRKKIKSNLS